MPEEVQAAEPQAVEATPVTPETPAGEELVNADHAQEDKPEAEKVVNPFNTIPDSAREKTRENLSKLYFDQAFQLIVDAEYELTFLPEKQKQLEESKAELECLNNDIKAIEDGPEYHTRQNRELVKIMRVQVESLQAQITALETNIENIPAQLNLACERAAKHIKKGNFIAEYNPQQ